MIGKADATLSTTAPAVRGDDRASPAKTARRLLRSARRAALGTAENASGTPYVSLVAPATAADGAPVLLLSSLARHTRNLIANARVSLLLEEAEAADPMSAARVTVIGTAERIDDEPTRARYLARHPGAAGYADFADFGIWRLEPEGAHLIAGFGRIVDLGRADLLTDVAAAEALLAAEADIVAHMNTAHADTVGLYATVLLGAPPGPWRFDGLDPDGCELSCGGRARYLSFPERVAGPGDVRRVLVALAETARRSSRPS